MLYHYTDRLSAADIIRDGVIRATPITLHRDMFAKDKGLVTPPIVWLTINPILDTTVIVKMMNGGWPKQLTGDLCRFILPADYCDTGLGEWTDQHKIDPSWWDWTVETGRMAGSDYTTWRLVDHDIPKADWLSVEKLVGFNEQGTIWEPI